VRSLAQSLTRCPGCSLRPPGPTGCCDACWRSLLEPVRTGDVLALGRYRGPLGAVLRSAKFGGATGALDALAARLAAALREDGVADLPVVPVPSHTSRRRRRGPDPSWRLARAPAPDRVVAALRRRRDDPPQSRRRPLERERNVRGAFEVVASAAPLVRGRSLVLLDDVLTSGATARACAAALARVEATVALVAVVALS
jgi:predicted amidophosphoribosyltransferase